MLEHEIRNTPVQCSECHVSTWFPYEDLGLVLCEDCYLRLAE